MAAKKCNGLVAANDQPAKELINNDANSLAIPCAIGRFPPRHNTVTAEVLTRLIGGAHLKVTDALFLSNTTHLPNVIHYLASEYGWHIDHVDIFVGTSDGRLKTIRAYFLPRAVIRLTYKAGALKFCRSVKAARIQARKRALIVKAEASKRNFDRAIAKFDPCQGSVTGGAT